MQKEVYEEPDATPRTAREKSTSCCRRIEMHHGKDVKRKKDALCSPAMKGCSPKSVGKIVRKRDLGLKLKTLTVANLKKLFETSSLTTGYTEGPSQQLHKTLYSEHSGHQTSSSICVSQSEEAIENEPRDILDLRFGASQDWSEVTSQRCTEPMRMQKRGACAKER